MKHTDRVPNRYRMSSADTAARFLAMYRRPAKNDNLRPYDTAKIAAQFRADVMSKLGRLVPKSARQIRQDLEDDLGGFIGERRVYNALTRLIADGEVKRVPDGYVRRRA